MPKKSDYIQVSDPKHLSQKQRTKLKNQLQNLKHEKMTEDLKWKETDKNVLKKQSRKEERELKKVESNERKVMLRKKAEQELDQMEESNKKPKPCHNRFYVPRVTQAQIEESKKVTGNVGRTTHISSLDADIDESQPKPLPKNVVTQNYTSLENFNRLNADTAHASNVDEAIIVLSNIVGNTSIDNENESSLRRSSTNTDQKTKVKSSVLFSNFKERELPRLKADNPTLTYSQLNQMIVKLWVKSAENPANMTT